MNDPKGDYHDAIVLVRRMMGARSGPHLLSDKKAARGYRLIEACKNILLAAYASEVGWEQTMQKRLSLAHQDISRTLKEKV